MTPIVEGFAGFHAWLDGLAKKWLATDYTDRLAHASDLIRAGEQRAFANQREPGGSAWEPLRPSTIARKGHAVILAETGRLGTSLTRLSADSISIARSRELLFGTRVEYSTYHQHGTSRMPARVHVGMSRETLDDIVNLVADAAVNSMRG